MKIFYYLFLFFLTACAVHKTPLPSVTENPAPFAKLTTSEIKKILDTPLCMDTSAEQDCVAAEYTFADAFALLYTEMHGNSLQKAELVEKIKNDPLFQDFYLLQEPPSGNSSLSTSPVYVFRITGDLKKRARDLRFTFKGDRIYILPQ